jgi:uncharacterized protein (TIGR04255 family)
MKKQVKPISAPGPQYPTPPILEAVIGITFSQALDDKTLAKADNRIGKHYPAHEDLHQANFNVSLNMGEGRKMVAAPTESNSVHGHKRMNSNMDELAVLMPSSITVSQLAPYPGWDTFMTRFKRDFHGYMGRQKSRQVSRVGVRYINRIDIPVSGEIVEHEQYLNFYPRVSDALGPIVGFGMQVSFAIEKIDGQVTLRTVPVTSPTLGHASFMLDIDVYKMNDLPMNEAALYELLEQMRIEKNRVFEECITDRARQEIFGHANS